MHSKIKELPCHKLRVNDMLFGNNPEKFDIKNQLAYQAVVKENIRSFDKEIL
ncbi:MAG: hypothetical protein RAP70_09660 [Candidatus Celaenobacter antarcticus]|nr:hypothetical protein [Candidatus Celaenobacter antarcticus]